MTALPFPIAPANDAEALVERLRREFDETFARPPVVQPEYESFLGLSLRDDPFAIRLAQIEGVLTDRRVVSLPTAVPAFAGLTTHRGALIPVYDLGILLGHAEEATLRWIVTVRFSEALLGLGFDRFDGHFRVLADSSGNERPATGLLSIVPGLLEERRVIEIPSLLRAIRQVIAQPPDAASKGVQPS